MFINYIKRKNNNNKNKNGLIINWVSLIIDIIKWR